MITQALRHCHGIGPARLEKLHAIGIRCWQDVIAQSGQIPQSWRTELLAESRRCLTALDAHDVAYFVKRFDPRDQWRIVAHFMKEVSFFDIETAGLEYDDPITVIVCSHQGVLRTFVEHENLDDFLLLLDEMTLLTSFNGSSFDVPRLLSAFHIPELPCAHLDLRWLAYHQGLRGGLKDISARLGIFRPADLCDADGALAVHLWNRWQHDKDRRSRAELIRYCAADVLLLVVLAQQLAGQSVTPCDRLWSQLPAVAGVSSGDASKQMMVPPTLGAFGAGSPSRIRARLRRKVSPSCPGKELPPLATKSMRNGC